MRLSGYAFLAYCMLRGAAVYMKPEKMLELFPDTLFDIGGTIPSRKGGAENAEIALSCTKALATLIIACGLLTIGGVKGRFASFAVIFAMFYSNHIVLGLAHPPVVPVVVTNVVVLALNVYEAAAGGSLGKWSYLIMQGGFGLLFMTEAPDLAQDPFTYAKTGTPALYIGQKLGFIIGVILVMHAAITYFDASVIGCVAAMAIIISGFAKIILLDGFVLPMASAVAAGVCLSLCLYDLVANGTGVVKKKGTKKK